MKKLLFVFLCVLCALCGPNAFAADQSLTCAGGRCFTGSYALLSEVTATGQGGAVGFKYLSYNVPVSQHMCTATWGGTAPTNIVFEVDCSENGTSFPAGALACASVTMTASPWIIHISKPGILYLKGNYVSKTGGDATTSLTLTCASGGH